MLDMGLDPPSNWRRLPELTVSDWKLEPSADAVSCGREGREFRSKHNSNPIRGQLFPRSPYLCLFPSSRLHPLSLSSATLSPRSVSNRLRIFIHWLIWSGSWRWSVLRLGHLLPLRSDCELIPSQRVRLVAWWIESKSSSGTASHCKEPLIEELLIDKGEFE